MSDLYSLITFIVCAITIFFMLYRFGIHGLFAYSVVVVIAANIQVLKVAEYSFFNTPVPLGTVIFSTMFAVDNIINEHYGLEKAKQCVFIGFASYLFFAVIMLLADWHPEVKNTQCANMHQAIHDLFSPSFVFFVSSITAYLAGQLLDVYVFDFLKKKIKNLSLRSGITMMLSTFMDNLVFSILAWKVLSSIYIPWSDIIHTYILGSTLFRFVIAICCIPLVKLSYRFVRNNYKHV